MADDLTGRPARENRRSSVERFADRMERVPADSLFRGEKEDEHRPAEPVAPPAATATPAAAPERAAVPPTPALSVAAAQEGTNGPSRLTRNRVKLDMEGLRAAGLVTSYTDRSPIAEEFRLIKRPLLLKAFAQPPDDIVNGNLIMVTSAKAGEGKTFCAISLAMSIAQERDLTVLLIDADVAKPDIPRVLGIETHQGLVDLIADENDSLDLSDVLVRTDLENLTILPAGRQHHLATELLASEKMDKFVKDIARRYPDRVIIIDSPPVLMSSVPGVLALHVGQILFVVEAGRTVQPSVDTALGLISTCNDISLLLNKTPAGGNNESFGAYYGYGYGTDR